MSWRARRFERGYAARSGLTLKELRQWRTVRRCRCGEEGCKGFASVSLDITTAWDDLAPAGGRVTGPVIRGLR